MGGRKEVPLGEPLADGLTFGGEPAGVGANLLDGLLDSTLRSGRLVSVEEGLDLLGLLFSAEVSGGRLHEARKKEAAIVAPVELVPVGLHELPRLRSRAGFIRPFMHCIGRRKEATLPSPYPWGWQRRWQ